MIGTGRHWSSRLDNQLRGRSGRQGDPGSSVFFVSMEDELITTTRRTPPRRATVAADGRVSDPRAHWTVGHAQRVAEGANLEIHRNTWRYNKLIEDQRRIVLEHRDRVLTTDAALAGARPPLPAAVRRAQRHGRPEVLDDAARQIVLYHLDRGWADHLAALADVREGIHLRALGRGLDPLTEFHREAVKLFAGLLPDVEERSAETFRTVPITPIGSRSRRGRAEAAHRHLDLPRAGQPVRHRHRPGPAAGRPHAARLAVKVPWPHAAAPAVKGNAPDGGC